MSGQMTIFSTEDGLPGRFKHRALVKRHTIAGRLSARRAQQKVTGLLQGRGPGTAGRPGAGACPVRDRQSSLPRESVSTCRQTAQCALKQLRVPALTLWLVRGAEGQTDMPAIPGCFLLVMLNPPPAPCRRLCNHETEGQPLLFQKILPSFLAFVFS